MRASIGYKTSGWKVLSARAWNFPEEFPVGTLLDGFAESRRVFDLITGRLPESKGFKMRGFKELPSVESFFRLAESRHESAFLFDSDDGTWHTSVDGEWTPLTAVQTKGGDQNEKESDQTVTDRKEVGLP